MKYIRKMAIFFISFIFGMAVFSPVQALSIRDVTGIREDEGEMVRFHHFKKDYSVKLTDYLLPGLGIAVLDVDKAMELARRIDAEIKIKEQSAYINQHGALVDHLTGISLDYPKFLAQMQTFLYDPDATASLLPVQFIPPRVTTQQLKQAMERRISSFTTYYNSANKNRSHNIYLASKAIHHYVVLPGETFSFNKIVGKRTTERGYKRAPVIVRGELSEGIGGGICQVSSTLFNAADRAGLTILKRYSHSKQVGYVPPGRDATVSWYGPDFVFRNDYDHPVMIKSYADNGIHTVSIYSSHVLKEELRPVPEPSKKLPKEIHAD